MDEEQRKNFEKAWDRWKEVSCPLEEFVKDSKRITHEDLRITIIPQSEPGYELKNEVKYE